MILRSGRKLSKTSHNINFIVCEKNQNTRKRVPRINSYFKHLKSLGMKNKKILTSSATTSVFFM